MLLWAVSFRSAVGSLFLFDIPFHETLTVLISLEKKK